MEKTKGMIAAEKIAAATVAVVLHRLEGYHDEVGMFAAESIAAANKILTKWARTAPDNGGYDKVDFIVICKGGRYGYDRTVEYTGRFDMKRDHSVEGADLLKQMGEYIDYQMRRDANNEKVD